TDKGSNSYPRQCSGSGGRRSASALRFGRSFCRQGRILLIQQDTDRRAVQILVLAGLQRPEETAQPDKTEANRSRDQIDEYTHCTGSGFIFIPLKPATARALAFLRRRKPLSRMALRTTTTEEQDMATAAKSGVTKPMTAKGSAIAL